MKALQGFIIFLFWSLGFCTSTNSASAETQMNFFELNQQVQKLLLRRCATCHHEDSALRTSRPEKGVAGRTPINLPEEQFLWLEPGNAAKSDLLALISLDKEGQAEMPEPPVPALEPAEISLVADWINCMPSDLTYRDDPANYLDLVCKINNNLKVYDEENMDPTLRHVSLSEIYEDIKLDLEENLFSDPRLPNVRYVTLANLANSGDFDEESLDVARAALTRGLNSVSSAPRLARFEPIDDQDLTFRFYLNDLNWDVGLWAALMAEYPYRGFPADASTSDITRIMRQIERDLGTKDALVRADWLLRIVTHPGRYDALLRMPRNLNELEAFDNNDGRLHLGVNLRKNLTQNQVIRGGFQSDDQPFEAFDIDGNRVLSRDSGVSGAARVIERQDIGEYQGYYWKSYDFRQNSSGSVAVPVQPFDHQLQQLLFELGQVDEFRLAPFEHDGGEMIFSLPNGLQGYWITTADGETLNAAPHDIVNWSYSGEEVDGSVQGRRWEFNEIGLFSDEENIRRDGIYNGLPCMSCHTQGMRLNKDFTGAFFDQPRARLAPHVPSLSEHDAILRIYDDDRLSNSLSRDKKFFARAVLLAYEEIGLTPKSKGWNRLVDEDLNLRDVDPVTEIVHRYVYGFERSADGKRPDHDALLNMVANELWLSPVVLQQYLDRGGFPELQNAIADRSLSREFGLFDRLGFRTFECEFGTIARGLAWANTNLDLVNWLGTGRSICTSHTDTALQSSGDNPKGSSEYIKINSSPALPLHAPNLTLKLSSMTLVAGSFFDLTISTDQACELWLIDLSPDTGEPRVIRPGKLLPNSSLMGEDLLGNVLSPEAPIVIRGVQAEFKPGLKQLGAICTAGGARSAGLTEELALSLFRDQSLAERQLELSFGRATSNLSRGLTIVNPSGSRKDQILDEYFKEPLMRGARSLANTALSDRIATTVTFFQVL